MQKINRVRIPRQTINSIYRPMLDCSKRYLVLYGGAGSGKSVFAVQRFLIRLMREPKCNILVVRKVAATNRNSTYALFKQIIFSWKLERLFRFQESNLQITCICNQNSAVFRGLDNVEKLKSITFSSGGLTEVWIEEASEISEHEFQQLDIRMRGVGIKGQIVLTFNPISETHWLKKRFFDDKLDNAQTIKTTYQDNRFLTREYQDLLEGFKGKDPYYYQVYCLGHWGVLGGNYFDASQLGRRLRELPPAQANGFFVCEKRYDIKNNDMTIDEKSICFIDDSTGGIRIYQKPAEGHRYVIGADTAGEGSDWFCAQVVDHMTGEQVCTLRQQLDEDLFVRQLFCLGVYYGHALIAVEANFSSYPVKELERLGYQNQYVRTTEDNFTHKLKSSFGFKTTAVTRPIILAGLVAIAREQSRRLFDRQTLLEMLAFTRNERGRPEAAAGAHDDCVMALAIAYYCREQMPAISSLKRNWTSDMLADFHRAKPKERALLLARWG